MPSILSLECAAAPTDGENEMGTITVSATGGHWHFIYSGQTTTPLDWNATAAVVQAAIEALSNVGTGNILIGGGPGDAAGTTPYTYTWIEGMGGQDLADPTTDATALTGTGTATVAKTNDGVTGSFKGAGRGSILVDTTNKVVYKNTGTWYAPVWTTGNEI